MKGNYLFWVIEQSICFGACLAFLILGIKESVSISVIYFALFSVIFTGINLILTSIFWILEEREKVKLDE